jgi:DUF1680 family protein
VSGEAVRIEPANWSESLYQPQTGIEYTHSPLALKAVPYCFWANRQPGEMRVWIREL